jgi:hypothetical protein
MKKQLWGLAAALLMSPMAHAGSLVLDMRFDADSTRNNDDATAAGLGTSYYRTYFQTGRIDYNGKYNDDLTFRTRLRFNRNVTDATFKDQASRMVDFAYFTHKMSDMFSLRVGKIASDAGGWDGMMPNADIYYFSQGFQNSFIYITGFRGIFTFGDNELSIFAGNTLGNDDKGVTTDRAATATGTAAVFNNNDPVHSNDLNQAHITTGVIYKGSFMEKSLLTVVSYYVSSPNDTATPNSNRVDTYITAGLKYKGSDLYASLDYDAYTFADKSSNGQNDTLSSIIANVGYAKDEHKIIVGYESSAWNKKPVAGISSFNVSTAQIAYEYHPFKDDSFRYHLAYTSNSISNISPTAPNSNPTTTDIIAGARILTDFLK